MGPVIPPNIAQAWTMRWRDSRRWVDAQCVCDELPGALPDGHGQCLGQAHDQWHGHGRGVRILVRRSSERRNVSANHPTLERRPSARGDLAHLTLLAHLTPGFCGAVASSSSSRTVTGWARAAQTPAADCDSQHGMTFFIDDHSQFRMTFFIDDHMYSRGVIS